MGHETLGRLDTLVHDHRRLDVFHALEVSHSDGVGIELCFVCRVVPLTPLFLRIDFSTSSSTQLPAVLGCFLVRP